MNIYQQRTRRGEYDLRFIGSVYLKFAIDKPASLKLHIIMRCYGRWLLDGNARHDCHSMARRPQLDRMPEADRGIRIGGSLDIRAIPVAPPTCLPPCFAPL